MKGSKQSGQRKRAIAPVRKRRSSAGPGNERRKTTAEEWPGPGVAFPDGTFLCGNCAPGVAALKQTDAAVMNMVVFANEAGTYKCEQCGKRSRGDPSIDGEELEALDPLGFRFHDGFRCLGCVSALNLLDEVGTMLEDMVVYPEDPQNRPCDNCGAHFVSSGPPTPRLRILEGHEPIPRRPGKTRG